MRLSTDGARYVAKVRPRPFSWRWLLPALCRRNERAWRAASIVGVALCVVGGWIWGGWPVGVFVLGCAGITRLSWKFPVLVDAFAQGVAICTAAAVVHGWWPLAVVLALIGGATCEKAPIFTALYAWSPLPLVGLAAVGWFVKSGPDVLDAENAWILKHPFRASVKYHRRIPPWAWILPWGVGLAAFGSWSWQLAATCAAAYGMCVVATDTVRIYQWAWPVVARAAFVAVPPRWWPLMLLVHLVNPYATEGI